MLADSLAGEDPDPVPSLAGGDEADRRLGCTGGVAVTVPEDPPPELVDEEVVPSGTLFLKLEMAIPRAFSAALVETPTTGSVAIACS